MMKEFIAGVRETERGLHDVLMELENRRFIARILRMVIMAIFIVLGVTIALEAINLQIAVLVSAISLLLIAVTMAVTGIFGRLLTSFVFLVFSHPYFRGDLVRLGDAMIQIRKVTLLNTFGYTPDNKWVMYDNATVAVTRIENHSRSADCVFVYETTVHPETTKKDLDTWERTIRSYIKSKPEKWRDFTFNIISVAADNKFNIEMKAYARGANWAHSEVYNANRAELWKVVHQSAVQLGVFGPPHTPETELVRLVTADEALRGKKPVEKDE